VAVSHLVLAVSLEAINNVTMPGVAETLKNIINEMTYGTEVMLVNTLPVGTANLTNDNLNTSI
jgi:hypothetical protein